MFQDQLAYSIPCPEVSEDGVDDALQVRRSLF